MISLKLQEKSVRSGQKNKRVPRDSLVCLQSVDFVMFAN